MSWRARFRVAACALALTGLFGCSAPRGQGLEVWSLGSPEGRKVATLPLDASRQFTLRYTHSMYGGTVTETFEVDAHPRPQLRRLHVETSNGGAAEYYARYGNMRQDGERWIVEVPPLELERVRMRVDGTGAPSLGTSQRSLALLSVVADGTAVELRPTGASSR